MKWFLMNIAQETSSCEKQLIVVFGSIFLLRAGILQLLKKKDSASFSIQQIKDDKHFFFSIVEDINTLEQFIGEEL